MPWHIEKRGDKFDVVKDDTGEVVGTHDTRASAEAQLRALYASENKTKRAPTPKCQYCHARAGKRVTAEAGRTFDVCAMHELNALHAIELGKDVVVDITAIVREQNTGVMVALKLPAELADAAVIEGGLPVDELHITLAFLGDTADVTATADDIVAAIGPSVAETPALELEVIGVATLAPSEEDAALPFVLLVSPTPALCALRQCVIDSLETAGIAVNAEYDFVPHITLDYIDIGDAEPARVAKRLEFEVDTVCVYVAAEVTELPLAVAPADAEPDAEMSKALYGLDLTVAKADAEMQYTLAPVYLPDTEDAHGEWVDAPTLQKAFWGYLENSREIHLQHTDTPAGTLVECVTWPVAFETALTIPGEDPKPITFPAGTVYAGIVWTDESWALIKAGKLRGLSMGGRASKVFVEFDA